LPFRNDAKIEHEENSSCVKVKIEQTLMETLLAAKFNLLLKFENISIQNETSKELVKLQIEKILLKVVSLKNVNEKIL